MKTADQLRRVSFSAAILMALMSLLGLLGTPSLGLQPPAESAAHIASTRNPARSPPDAGPGRAGQPVRFRERASLIDRSAASYPEIRFVLERDGKPTDWQHASVDLSVPARGRLMIWLMGHNQELFERVNSYGIHAIQVAYANQWFSLLCQPQPADSQQRGNVRLEAATGLGVSDQVAIAPADSIVGRSLRFVQWLAQTHPEGGWEDFLSDDRQALRWERVILAGASHGATTAARLAIHQPVDRVVMLCGPRDQDQDWQALPSATATERFFGFSHVLDAGWTANHYCRSWQLLGLHRCGPTVNIDAESPPYQQSRRLVSAADVQNDPRTAHSAVTPGRASPRDADGQYLYEPVWRYLFTHPVEQFGAAVETDPECVLAGER